MLLLEIAAELEKEALIAENRRAAEALLELYLSHHAGAAGVWHRLGKLRRRDGRLADALLCFQLAGVMCASCLLLVSLLVCQC